MRVARHQWIIREATVLRRVGDDEQAGLQNGMRANRAVQRGFANAQSDLGLEPLAPLVDQIDDRDRRAADRRCDLDDLVKVSLSGRVENAIAPQGAKAKLFGTVQVRFQR